MLPSSCIIDLTTFVPLHIKHQNKWKAKSRNGLYFHQEASRALSISLSLTQAKWILHLRANRRRERYKQVKKIHACSWGSGLKSLPPRKTNVLTYPKQTLSFFFLVIQYFPFNTNTIEKTQTFFFFLNNAMHLWLSPDHARGCSILPQAISFNWILTGVRMQAQRLLKSLLI